MKHFFSPEAASRGAEYGDLESTLEKLHGEMRYQHLYMNALAVYRNQDRIVENLEGTELPIGITAVTVKEQTSPNYGSLQQFMESGGRIIYHGNTLSIASYLAEDRDINAVVWTLGNCEVDGPSNTYFFTSIDRTDLAGVLRGRKKSD